MKTTLALSIILFIGSALANEFCINQHLLGFEEAVFILGKDVANTDVQETIDRLVIEVGMSLVQIDTFVTSKTYYELLRNTLTNELVLMTVSAESACFYRIPTEELTRQIQVLSPSSPSSTNVST